MFDKSFKFVSLISLDKKKKVSALEQKKISAQCHIV